MLKDLGRHAGAFSRDEILDFAGNHSSHFRSYLGM
jgi:hypothetical protein